MAVGFSGASRPCRVKVYLVSELYNSAARVDKTGVIIEFGGIDSGRTAAVGQSRRRRPSWGLHKGKVR